MAKSIISIAKKNNSVKSLGEAFKDIPTSKEDHKGKLSYFNEQGEFSEQRSKKQI